MVVGQGQGVVDVAVGQHTQHRAKDLVLHDLHVLTHLGQQGGGVEVAGAARQHAAAVQLGALRHCPLHHGVDIVPGRGADQRPHVLGLCSAVAKCARCQPGFQLRHQGVVYRLLHIDPLHRRAQLPAVGGLGAHDVAGRLVQISVGGHDGGRFAAKFERHLGNVGLGVVEHAPAGIQPASEGDHGHLGVGAHGLGLLVPHGHDVDHARRQAGVQHRLGDLKGRAGGVVAGPHHHRVTGNQGRRDLAQQGVDRVIERNQAGHHAHGLAVQHEVFTGGVAGDDLALNAARPLGVVARHFGGVHRLIGGVLQAFAGFLGQGLPNLCTSRHQGVGQFVQVSSSRYAGQFAPAALGGSRLVAGLQHLRGAGGVDRGEMRLGGRVVHSKRGAILGGQPLVADEVQVSGHVRNSPAGAAPCSDAGPSHGRGGPAPLLRSTPRPGRALCWGSHSRLPTGSWF